MLVKAKQVSSSLVAVLMMVVPLLWVLLPSLAENDLRMMGLTVG
jgi:hypothetical protein